MLYDCRMCKVQAAIAVAFAVGLIQGPAQAQSAGQQDAIKRYKPQPLNLHKDQVGTEVFAADARKRMAAGDCEGALASFDAALRTSTEPTLYRDRGQCHDKLGHPYPAMDDYREYLTAEPNAPDAENLRTRLAELEDETSGRTGSKANDDTDVPPAKASATASASLSMSESGVQGSTATSHDKLEYREREDDPIYAVLRRGKGFALAPFFSEHKWFFSGTSFGSSETWSENVGLQFRYLFGPAGGLLVEAGYEHFNTTSLDPFTIGGLTSLVALELRFPIDPDYNNQLFLAPGVGYEHIMFSPSSAAGSSIAANAIDPRLRFGYRHLLQDAASIDVSIDGGWAKWFVSSNGVSSSNVSDSVVVAANVAVVWGL
jgi:hypothetical protein